MAREPSLTSPDAGPVDRSEIERIVRGIVQARMGTPGRPPAPKLMVQASSRHIHLCREHMDTLFGIGSELTVHKDLYQAGNYAAKEMVTIVGPRGRLISNLRVLGPLRKQSQVELAFTDAISLGYPQIPIRVSGNIAGTPGCFIMGPGGMVELKEGLIRAAIHVHMNQDEANYYGVKQGDMMKLRVGGDAGLTFNRVAVRIDPASRLDVHMDTDEANACGLHLTKDIELMK